MAYEVVIPRLGLTMEEGRLVEWYKAQGEQVEAGEPLFSVETDKVVLDVEAPYGGVVHHLSAVPDEPLPIGTPIGYILVPGEEPPHAGERKAQAAAPPPAQGSPRVQGDIPVRVASEGRKLSSPAARRRAVELGLDWRTIERPGGGPILLAQVEAAAGAREAGVQIEISPVARRLAETAGVSLAELAAQKPGERIRRADVEAAIAAGASRAAIPSSQVPGGGAHALEVTPISQLRRIIAQRMAASARTTAAVPLITEADASELVVLRERLKATLGPRDMLIPTYTDLIVKLTGVALQMHPGLNARLEEEQLVISKDIHIGIAVDTEAGLLVPVVHDVQRKSLQEIAQESRPLVERARNRSLRPEELQGGTFTVTNLGMYGIDAFAPIINLPECAILGVGRIITKPAVVNGEIVPRELMTLSLTFDHRVVDGGPAARFLNTVREFVEEPYLWLTK